MRKVPTEMQRDANAPMRNNIRLVLIGLSLIADGVTL